MKTPGKILNILLLLIFLSKSGRTQDYNTYKATNARMLQVNGDMHTEDMPGKAVITLSGTNALNVRMHIQELVADLRMNVNLWQIQNYLTSSRSFNSQGLLTLNNITKTVRVTYTPIPEDSDDEGDFNISMNIEFYARDFNPDASRNSLFIIKINDANVNRI